MKKYEYGGGFKNGLVTALFFLVVAIMSGANTGYFSGLKQQYFNIGILIVCCIGLAVLIYSMISEFTLRGLNSKKCSEFSSISGEMLSDPLNFSFVLANSVVGLCILAIFGLSLTIVVTVIKDGSKITIPDYAKALAWTQAGMSLVLIASRFLIVYRKFED